MTNPSRPERKRLLRAEMRRILTSATDDAPVRDAVGRWLAERPQMRRIAAYAPLPGEVDLLPLMSLLPGREWYFPRIEGERLALHRVANPAEFVLGPWSIREPAANLPEIEAPQIDAFLCPGLAFDSLGGRLGRGRGFYDRLLSMARPDAFKIGICRPEQLVAETFSESHDIAMDVVISG